MKGASSYAPGPHVGPTRAATSIMHDDDPNRLLEGVCRGDEASVGKLTPIVYEELRRLARHYLQTSKSNTLQPTALVHEAYLKLADQTSANARSQTHFCAVAAVAMRHVLIDHVRNVNRLKRGGDRHRVTLTGVEGPGTEDDAAESGLDAEDIEHALTRLAELDPRATRVVELRFFGGLSEVEIAEVLGVTERTVRNDWRMARAWLRVELGEDE